jgi:hypothetical protein
MNKNLEKLKNVLSKISYSGDQSDHILIKEDDPLATLKTVTLNIDSKLQDWFSFSPDKILNGNKRKKNKSLIGISPLLTVQESIKYGKNESIDSQHNKTCDCVVFLLEDKELKIIFIELKSSLKNSFAGKKANNQIKSTEQFVKYFLGLASEFYEVNFETSSYYVIFHNTPLRKRPTIQKNTNKPFLRIITVKENGLIFLKQII